MFEYKGNDDTDDTELLLSVFKDIVEPFLDKYSNSAEICERITVSNCRDAFVQFAARLAVKKEIGLALRIIQTFVNDPDPYLPDGDPEDPKNEYNEYLKIQKGEEPHAITSVRGWCGWALMKCAVLEGREQIPQIIELVRKLTGDENYYVVHMSCFALSQLVRNRLTVIPSDKEVLFFNDDRKKALRLAKDVESIAFNLLDRLSTWEPKVQEAMAESILHVFDPLRALNEEDSLRFVSAVVSMPSKAIQEAAPLLIYFAEFRKNAYISWKFSAPGLYDDLGPGKFDPKKFKNILLVTIGKIQKENPDDCFAFAAQLEKAMREVGSGQGYEGFYKSVFEYFDLLTNYYSHSIYNLVYKIVQDRLLSPDQYLGQWFKLLSKCFQKESEYFEQQVKTGNATQIYWYPSLYHSSILELVYQKLGKDKFMQVAKTYFRLPKEIELHESGDLVSIVQEIAKSDETARCFIESLIERNPSAYWDLRKEFTKRASGK